MFSTCLFCHAPLGANDSVEHFPVGRRLAFDAAKGRLWVVCAKCERWNLSPIEERWEAIEDCGRLFAGTHVRTSTEHVGLARLRDGLELVRIGAPLRPEFAAWRYGDQFGRRRTRTLIGVGLGLTALGGVIVGGAVVGVGIGGFMYAAVQMGRVIVRGNPRKVVARLSIGEPEPVIVRRGDLRHAWIANSDDAPGWALHCEAGERDLLLTGDMAERAAARLLPSLNRYGGTRDQVQHAVSLIEEERAPLDVYARIARWRTGLTIERLPAHARLALEMAAHEEIERRALEGELAQLEAAWREAEEIAAIADNLLLPESASQRR